MENRNTIITFINGARHEIDGHEAFKPLARFLREDQSLTGTKIVCSEGDCGACTVLLARDFGDDGKLIYKSVNSCILPLYLIDGAHVVSVEGLKKNDKELHPVQESMVNHHGAQCGYCTPGFVCAMTGLCENVKSENKTITEKKAKNFLTGNLCRCTGYKPIIDAAVNIDLEKVEVLKDRYNNPAWLLEIKKIKTTPVVMNFNGKNIFLPVTVAQALKAKFENADVRLIAGSTDLGVVVNKGKLETPKAMALYHIEELKKIEHNQDEIIAGATVTLSEFENYIEMHIPELENILHIFASPQIKNLATLVGNAVNASPIADTIPYLMASDSKIVLINISGEREVLIKDFYLGYKKLDMSADEIVKSIKIPRLKKSEYIKLYKVSMRKDLDISAVTFAGIVEVEKNKILKAKIALGGVAATVVRLNDIEKKMVGMDFKKETFQEMAMLLSNYISPLSDLRASKEYRMLLCQNFFKKFYDEVKMEMKS